MTATLEQRIKEERIRITTLDSSLDSKRTPYIKGQLRFAGHVLDDAEAGLRRAKQSPNEAMWVEFAERNLQFAAQRRQRIQDVVEKYGGPERIDEVGG